ncbi:MAG: hypothetical protein H6742_18280 [Alphaproteobacteria bacterium]|nr:hypothetical protein [Alphaproteobacteria bacterium]
MRTAPELVRRRQRGGSLALALLLLPTPGCQPERGCWESTLWVRYTVDPVLYQDVAQVAGVFVRDDWDYADPSFYTEGENWIVQAIEEDGFLRSTISGHGGEMGTFITWYDLDLDDFEGLDLADRHLARPDPWDPQWSHRMILQECGAQVIDVHFDVDSIPEPRDSDPWAE